MTVRSLNVFLGVALLACGLGTATAAASTAARVRVVLDVTALPLPDRERAQDRLDAIAESLREGSALFRSFDPREVLEGSLAELAGLGADVGASAVVNFDTLELDVPHDARREVAALPWVTTVTEPTVATSAGTIDSEGLSEIGADLAHAAGITGAGITVAIIDDSFNHLTATSAALGDELPVIPTSAQHRVNSAASSALTPFNLNGTATQTIEGEHGTACAEIVYEVAPDASLLLIGFQALASSTQYEGGITSAQIEFAIRRAADLGAKVILVPLYLFHTMSSRTNSFTDDIDYATAAGATVVVAGGNEELRHVEETFAPCTDCTNGPTGICANALNDTDYHAWDPSFEAIPLNDLLPTSAVDDAERFETLTCYTATDATTPSDFEVRLLRFNFDSPCDFPGCPSDCGMTLVPGTTRDLGQGFTRKNLPIFSGDFDEFSYYLAVRRKAGTERPRIRVACTTGVEELYWATTTGRNLSDLAVVDSALTVGALDSFGELLFESSRGPTGDPAGPVKPDLVGPGEVSNYTVFDYGVSDSFDFIGSSASAAHVAGVVALLQSRSLAEDGALLSPAAVKQILKDAALDLGPVGEDFEFGAGLVQFPLDDSTECGNGATEPGEDCDDGNLVDGDCCSSLCSAEPAGSDCSDGDLCNGTESCDGAGACADGSALDCSDGDLCTRDECDPIEGCANPAEPATTCAVWDKASLVVDQRTTSKASLVAVLQKGPVMPAGALGDPLATGGTAYTACVYDDAGGLAGRIDVDRAGETCAGQPCWKSTGRGKGLRYQDESGAADGVRLLHLKIGKAGQSQIVLRAGGRGAGQNIPTGIAASLAGTTSATLQIFRSDASQCFSTTIDEVKKNGADLFKGRAR